MSVFQFSIEKTIQASAVLLKTEPARRMTRLRLLKLLYIADRESLSERAREITGDRPVAMENGPVLSTTYRLIKGEDFLARRWEEFIRNEGRDLLLASDPGVGELSRFEIAKLHAIAERFRDQDDWHVAEYTHEFPEWSKNRPAKGSSNPIPLEDLLSATGLNPIKDRLSADAAAEAVASHILESA